MPGVGLIPSSLAQGVPRLDTFLEWIKGKARVFIDVKFAHPQHLIDLLHETGMADQCFLWSGSNQLMRLFHILDPSIALKVNVSSAAQALQAQADLGATIVEVGPDALCEELLDTCHEPRHPGHGQLHGRGRAYSARHLRVGH